MGNSGDVIVYIVGEKKKKECEWERKKERSAPFIYSTYLVLLVRVVTAYVDGNSVDTVFAS